MRNVKNLSLCVLLLALASTATGATLYVPSDDYSTIQAAIDAAASSGDEIEVAPGTYTEAINFNGKAIRLYSADGRDATTIDATGLGLSVVTCNSGEGADTMLEGFTIKGGGIEVPGGGWVVNGGGMYNTGSSPTVKNCIFTSNRAQRGGGMLNDQNSNPTVTNCIFTLNWGEYGGGMYNAYGSNSTVTNCTFDDNDGRWSGGGMLNNTSNPTVTNCTFTSNWGDYGGGMSNGLSSPTVTNCTFSNNYCTALGGGMYNNASNPTVTNCIFWGNSPWQIYNLENSTADVTYSDIQGGWAGTCNINADPLFADADGRLLAASPCIDAGNDADVPAWLTTDLDGNPRIQGLCVDMGAFEAPAPVAPETMIARLKGYILLQVALGNIDVDLEGGLLDKVDAASETLARGNPNSAKPAMNNMKALINQVEAQTDKKITPDAAAAIIERANAIIAALGG